MPITAGPTGKGDVADAAPERFLALPSTRTRGFTTVRVICESDSLVPVGIQIPMIHGANWVEIAPGDPPWDFRNDDGGLLEGYAQGLGGTATFRWGANAAT